MKKIILFTLPVISLLVFPFTVAHSQTPTKEDTSTSSATTAPLNETEMKNVKKIIDLVASNSAEQKLTSKIGVIGTVAEKSNTTINLTTLKGNNRIIDIDEITKFSDPDSKTFGISDIKTGETLGVIGVLNKVSGHILGRDVDRLNALPTHFEGVITEIDRPNFQLTATDESGSKKILDIQTTSKLYSFTKDTGQIKTGFSKIEPGVRVFAAGFPDSKIKNQIEISRLIILPEVSLSEKMKRYVSVTPVEETATPSVKPTTTR